VLSAYEDDNWRDVRLAALAFLLELRLQEVEIDGDASKAFESIVCLHDHKGILIVATKLSKGEVPIEFEHVISNTWEDLNEPQVEFRYDSPAAAELVI